MLVKILLCSLILGTGAVVSGNAAGGISSSTEYVFDTTLQWRLLERISWGGKLSDVNELSKIGATEWLEHQIKPKFVPLPVEAESQINAMLIAKIPFDELARSLEEERRLADLRPSEPERRAAHQVRQQRLTALARESQQRFIFRALYGTDQLRTQMIWFWMNHFNIDMRKDDVRGFVADYEESAIRPNALGRFRDLLGAVVRHPAMLRYLDNFQNSVGHLNENYAREILELHTLGINGGYSQRDVQELSRVLTGVGITFSRPADSVPEITPSLRYDYVRSGLFEFNPTKHDYGPKILFGEALTQHGMREVDEALDRLARAPATARFISQKLATFFIGDRPSISLIDGMAEEFRKSDGDVAQVLRYLFKSSEFVASLGSAFKDPIHYAFSSVRLAYGDRVATNVNPIIDWINRMGQGLYGRETPDGYPIIEYAWTSPSQMAMRFEVAKALGVSGAILFRNQVDMPLENPPFPNLKGAILVREKFMRLLSKDTRKALDDSKTIQDWNVFFLSSPEFMRH